MYNVGVVGLGDMGSGLAKNLIKNKFNTFGLDINKERIKDFIEIGGKPTSKLSEIANHSEIVFVMVMDGNQAKSVILGKGGLVENLKKESVIILSATIKPSEVREIDKEMRDSDIYLIDSPVSGGYSGAQNGTLTMMAACEYEILDKCKPAMEAVSKTIHHVGKKAGDGQTVKACLQSLIGSIFSATFEASVLAAKAGVKGEILYNVFSTSGASCNVSNTALENIIDRKFFGTGSHISTMHKDLNISLDLANELGVPMNMASIAMQQFDKGKKKYPNGDNWIVTKLIEEIVGAELHR